MPHGRKRLASMLACGCVATLVIGLGPAAPTHAEPDIDTVSDRVDRLYHQAEQAQERYHDLQVRLDRLRGELKGLRADQRRQQRRLDAVRGEVEESIVHQYQQGQSVATVSQLLVADDPKAFLGSLSTMSEFNTLQAQLYDDYATELEGLDLRTRATADRAGEIEKDESAAAKEKEAVDDKLSEAKELLSRLEAEERARLAQVSRSSGREDVALPDVPASGRAAAAVQFALAQVGKAYVYGAAGPSAYDCSGLTMRAWGAAGVGLPHSSSAQMGSGARVSSSALQPGDLVFYYSPVSHVGIYIGGGQIVHAANPGTGVAVSGVFSMPFSGAVRPG